MRQDGGSYVDGRLRRVGAQDRRAGRRAVVGGGLVLAAAALGFATWDSGDPGTIAWVARNDVAAAAPLRAADFEQTTVMLPDPGVLFPATTAPDGTAARPINAGEPLLNGDVRAGGAAQHRAVTLTLPGERVPANLDSGARIDVWGGPAGSPTLLLADAPVAAVSAVSEISGSAQVELLVPESLGDEAVSAAMSEDLVLVRRP